MAIAYSYRLEIFLQVTDMPVGINMAVSYAHFLMHAYTYNFV